MSIKKNRHITRPKIIKTPLFWYNRNILQQTARDLLNKSLIPKHTRANFLDPNAIDIAVHNYMREPIKEYSCPKCLLTIKCPRQWIREHHKMCEKTHPYFEKRKDNEQLQSQFKVYY